LIESPSFFNPVFDFQLFCLFSRTFFTKSLRVMRLTLTFCALFGAFSVFCQQEFRVQVAAFADTLSSNYFRDRGLAGVYENTDQHGIHRFFIGAFSNRMEAEKTQLDLVEKGFPNAQIIDVAEQKALCGTPCPYFSANTMFASDTVVSKDAISVIYFDSGKHTINSEGMKILDEIFKKMKENTNLRLSVLGHSDAMGSAKLNLEMSIRRARMARNLLISKGIHSTRIKTKVFGESMPVAAATTIADVNLGKDDRSNQRSDRRVVLVLTDESGELK
jgi:outer membrane protein OmpA-like peptidoglycan-associated protein